MSYRLSALLGAGIMSASACTSVHVRGMTHPIIDLGLSHTYYQTYRASITGGSLFRIGVGALPFLLPITLQIGFGVSPATSGLINLCQRGGCRC